MSFIFGADLDIWRYQPHPEVWLIVGAAVGLGLWATRVIGPKVVTDGSPIVTPRQRRAFVAGVILLWIASDWPMHDISEEYLYFVHMIQHLMLTFVIPPLLLMAIPEWLARLIVSNDGTSGAWIRRMSRPVIAGFLFNFVVAITHTTQVVNTSVEIGIFHYFVHLVVFVAALLMWMPVLSPLPELRITVTARMIYLFMMSILPTVPAAFLTFAENPLYRVYDHDVRLWGIGVAQDQQLAGVVMKLGGGFLLWTIIGFLFFRWSLNEEREQQDALHQAASRRHSDLTFDDVTEAFERTPAPPG